MVDRVSDVVAFLCEHGAEAEELVFGDEDFGPLSAEELAAIQRAHEHAVDTFEAILTATRDVAIRELKGHACAGNVRKRWNRSATLRQTRSFALQLVPGHATCGAAIATWGQPRMHVHVWTWTRTEHVAVVERAVAETRLGFEPWDTGEGVRQQPWRNELGSHFVTVQPPAAGDSVAAIAEKVGTALAQLAKPIGAAVLARTSRVAS
ncbi:MAG: hypothetical protein ABMA64_00275 [Myxococcota bacterium]